LNIGRVVGATNSHEHVVHEPWCLWIAFMGPITPLEQCFALAASTRLHEDPCNSDTINISDTNRWNSLCRNQCRKTYSQQDLIMLVELQCIFELVNACSQNDVHSLTQVPVDGRCCDGGVCDKDMLEIHDMSPAEIGPNPIAGEARNVQRIAA